MSCFRRMLRLRASEKQRRNWRKWKPKDGGRTSNLQNYSSSKKHSMPVVRLFKLILCLWFNGEKTPMKSTYLLWRFVTLTLPFFWILNINDVLNFIILYIFVLFLGIDVFERSDVPSCIEPSLVNNNNTFDFLTC